jgi:hypothetical protein
MLLGPAPGIIVFVLTKGLRLRAEKSDCGKVRDQTHVYLGATYPWLFRPQVESINVLDTNVT